MHVIDSRLDFRDVDCRRGFRNRVFAGFTHSFDAFPLVLLGPNGAGKSTLLSLAAGLHRPDRGSIRVHGDVVVSSLADRKRHVALVPQESTGMRGLTVRELVAYAGWLRGMPRRSAWTRSEEVLDRLNLARVARSSSLRISGGEARRMTIAAALVSDPAIILFDEPTTGLDPAERANVSGLIAELASEKPVIVSTHEVDDIEQRFERIAVLDRGRIAFDGRVADFLARATAGLAGRARAEDAYRAVLTRGG